MNGAARIIAAVAFTAAAGWLAWMPLRKLWLEPRREKTAQIASWQHDVNRYRAGVHDHDGVTAALQAYADRTLGGVLEAVDHRLRTHLNRIGEELGLEGLSVGTGPVRAVDTPARSEFDRRTSRALRDETDFIELDGWISGQGTLEQALRLVHRIDAEPWLKRVSQVRLQPRDDGQRFAVTVRLTTLFLPDRAPRSGLPVAQADPGGFEPYAALTASNPFHVPAAPAAPPPRPSSPSDALAGWVLTGVVSGGPSGTEVWLLNGRSQESRRLAVGERLGGAELVAAAGEVAEFQLGDRRFSVGVGGRLSQGLGEATGPQG